MSSHGQAVEQGGVLYAPQPRRRPSAQGRRSITRLLCRAVGFLVLAGIAWLLYKTAQGIRSLKRTMDFPHHDVIFVEQKKGADGSEPPKYALVQPLINSTDPFSVRATVWLDVSEHLAQGHTLPLTQDGSPLPLITYNVSRNSTVRTRTEAILFSDVVMNLTNWQSSQFVTLPLRVPIDPLYTQDLGPSTLRLTTQIEYPKDREPSLGTLFLARSIFPGSDSVLPRSTVSPRIAKGLYAADRANATTGAESLSEALEHNGASSSLLALVASNKHLRQCPEQGSNFITHAAFQEVSPFLDNAYYNRQFTNHTVKDAQGRRMILDGHNCTLWFPHVLAKASVFLVPTEHPLRLDLYERRQRAIRTSAEFQRCFDGDETSLPSSCKSIRRNYGLETLLGFSRVVNVTEERRMAFFRYAPTLIQRIGAAGPQDHYTIPPSRPHGSDDAQRISTNCQLPILKVDQSNEFFNIDVQLRFGTAKGYRAGLIDQFHTYNRPSTSPIGEDEDLSDVRLHTSSAMDAGWMTNNVLVGDRPFKSSRTLTQIASMLLHVVSEFAIALSLFVYWYTRTTTAGLCYWAQWTGLASNVGGGITTIINNANNVDIPSIIFLIFLLMCSILQLLVLLRVEIVPPMQDQSWLKIGAQRRPKSKLEQRCRKVEQSSFGWQRVGMIIAVLALYEYLAAPHERIVRQGVGCHDDSAKIDESRWIAIMLFAERVAKKSTLVGQILFNTLSPVAGDKSKTGSFAGMLKITAWISFLNTAWQNLVAHVEYIGGQTLTRYPLTLQTFEMLVIMGTYAYQGVIYDGISMIEQEEEDL